MQATERENGSANQPDNEESREIEEAVRDRIRGRYTMRRKQERGGALAQADSRNGYGQHRGDADEGNEDEEFLEIRRQSERYRELIPGDHICELNQEGDQ